MTIRGMRQSAITGEHRVPGIGPFGNTVAVALYDGAEAVPVRDRDDPASIFTTLMYITDRWAHWSTFVCCGPAAPYPAAPDSWQLVKDHSSDEPRWVQR